MVRRSRDTTEFMLAEIEHSRQQLRIFMNRFESLLTFYMTVFGAIVSALAILFTSQLAQEVQNLSVALILTFSYGFSGVMFTRLCITRVMMAVQAAMERRAQEYFLTGHKELRKHAAIMLVNTEIGDWKAWRRSMFANQTLIFLYLMALFTAFLGVLSWSAILNIFLGSNGFFPLSQNANLYLLSGISFAMITVAVCHLILQTAQKKVESAIKDILGSLVSEGLKR